MGQIAFNVIKGKAIELALANPDAIGILLLKTVESDSLMKKHLALTDLLEDNDECDFTNYARKDGLTEVVTLDQVTGRQYLGVAGQTWTAAGGGLNNTIRKLVTYVELDTNDDDRIPITAHDFLVTTTGLDVPATMPASGFYYDA